MRLNTAVAAPGSHGRAAAAPSVFSRAIDSVARRLAGSARLHLPVAGLPPGVGDLVPGRPAVVLCADAAARERLLQGLLQAGTGGRRMTWICAPGRRFVAIGDAVREATTRATLRALSWAPDATVQLRQDGPGHFLRELEGGGSARDLLVVDLLDPWLAETADDVALEAGIAEAMDCLQRWGRERRGPLLALAPAHFRGQALLPLVAHAAINQLAVLRSDDALLRLDVMRWGAALPGSTGSTQASFALDASGSGPWPCRSSEMLAGAQSTQAADRATVHTTRNAVTDAGAMPAGWFVHASVESLVAATRDSVAATVVLAHDHPEAIATLAQTVHQLRKAHPRLLKIIVREAGVAMRRNASLAVQRLGANAVLERGLGFGHLAQLVEELRDETFLPAVSVGPEQALRRLAPDPVQGYLPAREFCAVVERMLDRTADSPIEHSLVRLPLLPHVAHIDALLACNARRDGDVVTADASGVYLFLYGCPPENAVAALDSLFSIPCSELAQHIQIDPDAGSQHDALAALRHATDDSPVDYSAFLRGASAARRPAPAQATVLPTLSAEAARSVHAHVLPLRSAIT